MTTVDEAREALLAMTPLTEHELVELRTWTAGVNHTSRALVERVIDEAECARFALNEVAIHLEGLQHIRKLTPTEQAVLAQVRDGLRAALAVTPAEPTYTVVERIDKGSDGNPPRAATPAEEERL